MSDFADFCSQHEQGSETMSKFVQNPHRPMGNKIESNVNEQVKTPTVQSNIQSNIQQNAIESNIDMKVQNIETYIPLLGDSEINNISVTFDKSMKEYSTGLGSDTIEIKLPPTKNKAPIALVLESTDNELPVGPVNYIVYKDGKPICTNWAYNNNTTNPIPVTGTIGRGYHQLSVKVADVKFTETSKFVYSKMQPIMDYIRNRSLSKLQITDGEGDNMRIVYPSLLADLLYEPRIGGKLKSRPEMGKILGGVYINKVQLENIFKELIALFDDLMLRQVYKIQILRNDGKQWGDKTRLDIDKTMAEAQFVTNYAVTMSFKIEYASFEV
jgi:hypothetical protein